MWAYVGSGTCLYTEEACGISIPCIHYYVHQSSPKNIKLCTHSHNDLAWQFRVHFENQLDRVDLHKNTSGADPNIYGNMWQTDIPRLRAGYVGGQVRHPCKFILAFKMVAW